MFGTNKTSTDSASSSSSNPLQPSTQLPIAEWNGVRKVCLFQDKNRLAFSTNGRTGDKTSFDPSPYNVHYASNLVLMFKNTIKANLDNDEPNPSSFIPLLTTQDGVQGTAQIVLFGRATPAKDNKPGLLQGIRWGVFYTVTKKEQTLDVVDASTQEYIKWAPPLNLRTSEIMSAYTKQFSIEIENENNGSIKKISLKYQRSWYETKGRSCPAALMDYLSSCEQQPLEVFKQLGLVPDPAASMDYLSSCEQQPLEVLKQLGLAPDQIASYCTNVEWAYFRTMMLTLDEQQSDKQQSIFKNLETQYPTIYPTLFQELKDRIKLLDQSENSFALILATLNKGVWGQYAATELMATALNFQQQTDECSVFLFVGPSGVGKTELAKVGATLKSNRLVRFDMDQFKGSVDFYKLFGAPAGHVGSTDTPLFAKELESYASALTKGSGTTFTRTVTDTIILFDELEKAHSQVKQSFLSLFDEMQCKIQYTSDKTNYVVMYQFKRCIFIGTSNLYKEEILEDFTQGMAPKAIGIHFKKLNIEKPIEQSYSTELLARMEPVPFGPIPKGQIYQNFIRSKLPSFLASLQAAVKCQKITITETDLPRILTSLETKLYGDGTGLRNVELYFVNDIKTTIFKQTGWGNLRHKHIIIIPLDTNTLGIKCVTEAYGKVIEEYVPVPVLDPGTVDIL